MNRHAFCLFLILLCALAPPPVQACEPIWPLIQALGGPLALSRSFIVLGVAVLAKALLFAVMQSRLSWVRAFLYMVLANVLTTAIGILVSASFTSPQLLLASVPLVWWLARTPSRRLVATAPAGSWLARRSSGGLAAFLAFAPILSLVFFALSASAQHSHSYVTYWAMKLGCIYLALLVSLVLTVFWEEWAVAREAGELGSHVFVKPVFRANAIVLACVAVYAAARVMPLRMQSPDFLIDERQIRTLEP